MKLLTTKEAGERLGVTDRRVRAMIEAGTLPAHQLSKEYAIEETALDVVALVERRPGRPPKTKPETTESATTRTKATAKKGGAK